MAGPRPRRANATAPPPRTPPRTGHCRPSARPPRPRHCCSWRSCHRSHDCGRREGWGPGRQRATATLATWQPAPGGGMEQRRRLDLRLAANLESKRTESSLHAHRIGNNAE
eukprot:15478560-Alexandrium_andersonii.AAC.2